MGEEIKHTAKWQWYQGPKKDPGYKSSAEIPGKFEEETPHYEREVPHIAKCITPSPPGSPLGDTQSTVPPASNQQPASSQQPAAASQQQPALPAIPADITAKAAHINALPKRAYAGAEFPSRSTLRQDAGLKADFSRDKGVLKDSSGLKAWQGDVRLFSADMWEYLAGAGQYAPRTKAAGVARDTPASQQGSRRDSGAA